MKWLCCFSLLLLVSVAHAQVIEEKPEPVYNSDDHPQFDIFAERGMVRGLMEFPAYSFYLGSPDINGVAYVPNFSPRLGAQGSWDDFRLTATFALPVPPEEVDRRGKSEQSSFMLSRYWRQYALDAYYQHYKGFYVSSPFTELDLHKADRYPQLPDATIANYGINIYYVVEPDHYSLSAAFSQIEFQAFDGGSWLINPFFNHLELSTGKTFIPGSDPSSLQTAPNIESTFLDTLGLGLGYGYTWVRDRRFLVAQGIFGVGGQYQQIDQVGTNDLKDKINLAAKANLNLSAGYNFKVYSVGAKVLGDTLFSSVRGTQLYSTILSAQFFFGGRF